MRDDTSVAGSTASVTGPRPSPAAPRPDPAGGPPEYGLYPGTGHDFGPYYRSRPLEERSLLRVLADRARDRAEHTWLVFDGADRLTFGAAHDLVNRVAAAVRDTVGGGAHVALFLRNQVEFLPSFYGVMAAGGVTIPLNAEARGPLLEDVVEQSDARLVVARHDLLDRLEALESLHDVELVVVVGGDAAPPRQVNGVPTVTFDAWLDGRPADPPSALPAWHETCLLQFTSGTTGRAKGAIYSHHFLYLYSATVADALERSPDDVLTTPLPLYHVAALHLIANSALHAGCTAHLKSRFSASRFWQQAAEDGATGGIILGPMAAMVLKATGDVPEHRMEHLWVVPPIQLEEFQERFGVRVVWQGYAMTEIEPMPMRKDMLPDVPLDTIGHVARWMEWGVVDEHDRMLPPGEKGELVFRCLVPHGMCDGYYGQPEVTAHTFRNFAFHTGDLASYDPGGLVHFHGRMKERIRRRGENISAPELEFVVLKHPHVLEVAAYGIPSELGEEDVKVDVVGRAELDLDELETWLEDNLPRYMVPRYLERRDSFPKTPSERIQKHVLQEQGVDRPEVRDREAGGTR